MTPGEPLYTARFDPEFAELANEYDTGTDDQAQLPPVRHRGDAVENSKAAKLFG